LVSAIPHLVRGLLRAPATFAAWFKERWTKMDLFDETYVDKARSNPWYAIGGMWYWVWMLVIFSGIVLMIYYVPVTDQAYHSIERIQQNWRWGPVPIGSLVRGLHKYGADAFIILATLRVYRMWFTGEYKQGHEFSFIIALLILIIGMYSGLTGYLLIWNQRALWATKVMATFPTYLDQNPSWLPGGDFINWTNQGKTTAQILLGGTSIGPATVTRFYAFHFMLSFLPMVFFELRVYRRGFRRMNIGPWLKLAVFGIILAIAIMIPAAQGSPANPEVTPNPILSDWYFLAMYHFLKLQDPYLATVLTVAIPFLVLLSMFLDRRPERGWDQRQIPNWIGIAGLIYFIVFSFLILNGIADLHRDAPLWYYSMGLFLLIGYVRDWAYVVRRDGKPWTATFHGFFVAFILVCMSAYFGDIREWNVRAKAEMPRVLGTLQKTNPVATPDMAYEWLEKNRPGLNLWLTSRKGPDRPAGMELWTVHVAAWLAIIAAGTFIGLGRWGRRKDAEAEAARAKALAAAAKG